MKHVGDLLPELPLSAATVPRLGGEVSATRGTAGSPTAGSPTAGSPTAGSPTAGSPTAGGNPCEPALLHDLGADLPAGHLHLWGGPPGAGKTSFLLSLLVGAAVRGRRVLYASYHLPASTLALRVMAMMAGVDAGVLDAWAAGDGELDEEQAGRAATAARCLERLPIHILEARGHSVSSLEDRLVRMPFRAEIVAVDYLQAVVRNPGTDTGQSVRALSALASRLHVAIVVALQGKETSSLEVGGVADRAGWIAKAGGSGLRRAEIIRNRYGERASVPLRLDRASGVFERIDGVGGREV